MVGLDVSFEELRYCARMDRRDNRAELICPYTLVIRSSVQSIRTQTCVMHNIQMTK